MNSRYILTTLKKILRKKKMTYRSLAHHLKMSEAGIKKMFASGDLSLDRLIKICDLVNISLDDLIQATKNRPVKMLEINKEQTEFFSEFPDYFFFFLKLVYQRQSLQQIAEESELTQTCIIKYLKKLDDLKLIKLHPMNEIEFLQSLPLIVDTNGPFFRDLKVKMAQEFIKSFPHQKQQDADLSLTLFALSRENINQLKEDLKNLQIAYQRQSEVDKTICNEDEIFDFSLLSSYSPNSFVPRVKRLKS